MNVDIALATYNGSRFLRPLLESLESQQQVSVRIVASDDGSMDDTLDVLRRPEATVPVVIVPGKPCGNILRNFENAIQATDAPYVALSDQDDVWDPRKLELLLARVRAIEESRGEQTPVLVFCDLEIVNRDLRVVSASFFESTLKSSRASLFRDFVLSNHVPGCAMLMNRALIDLALPFPEVDIHDHWLIEVAALFGAVEYVDQALIKYRQHGSNNIGLGASGRGGFDRIRSMFTTVPRQVIDRRKRWLKQADSIRRNMEALKIRFGETIPTAEMVLIDAILAGNSRTVHRALRYACTGERKLDYWGLLRAISLSAGSAR